MFLLNKFVSFSLIFAIVFANQLAQANSGVAKMVLVMDDIGYNLPRGKRAAELPGAITYAIIPHTPLAKKMAFYTINQDSQKEVIVHMPMQAKKNRAIEDSALTENLSRNDFIRRLREGMSNVPFAVGLSNHMGSALTQMEEPMQWLMSELQLHGYFFLDSRTTSAITARSAANRLSVPYLKRDIFLDHDNSTEAISRAFDKAINLAQQQGIVVVVAHPYPDTLAFLEKNLPGLGARGVELITASEAIKTSVNQQDNTSHTVVASNR